jgi:peptidoglycan/xylan/chitin deacetylase (PgdA/CDA1 family)
MSRTLAAFLFAAIAGVAAAAAPLTSAAAALPSWGMELHDRLGAADSAEGRLAAITLDACAGAFDADLIGTLVALRVPATIFVTKKWLDRNPAGTAALLAHPELFELEDHGAEHVPAFIGAGRRR